MSRSKTLSIEVSLREQTGSGAARKCRAAGAVPAVIYGHGSAATSLTVGQEALQKLLHHPGLIELTGTEGGPRTAIVKEVQRHPITGHTLHIDFLEVKADEVVQATVQLEPVGEPEGAHRGGQLEQTLHEIEIECLPADLPEVLEVDVTGMDLDDVMHVADLPIPEGIKALTDPELAVFQVRLPKVEEEAPAAEGEEGEEGEEAAEGQETADAGKEEE